MPGRLLSTHQRTLIRNAIVRKLTKVIDADANLYPTDAEDRVYGSRIAPMYMSELPAICVYTADESSEVEGTSPMRYRRKPTVSIEIHDECGTDLDDDSEDRIDAIARQVEFELLNDPYLTDPMSNEEICYDQIEIGSTKASLISGGEKEIIALTLTITTSYLYDSPEIIDDGECDMLVTADTQYETSSGHEGVEAHDRQTFEELT